MKVKDFLTEIKRLDPKEYRGGKEQLVPSPFYRVDFRSMKRLPGDSGFYYSVEKSGSSIQIQIWDKSNKSHFSNGSIIGELNLDKPYYGFPIKNSYEVSTIIVDEDYRNKGIAKSMYGIAINILGYTLLAGESQTPGGMRNWVSLYNIPGVEVMGYVKIDIYDWIFKSLPHSQDEVADMLMGELGAINLGKVDRNYHFAFPVKPNKSMQQLKAQVETKISKIYPKSSKSDYEVGMLAHWVG